ncbi:MAG TPA: ABC transporter substrate-binding protein [Acetobacteraceae bacterium]|jgi:NitT/TauT family transport system substrate-binding protein|nr:ABC transporter substrate-binding protein [Acetobacteraceae bacterium]
MRRWIFAALLAGLTIAHAAEPTHITLVQSSLSFNFVPLYIAQTNGYFTQEGLNVDVVLAGGGPKAMTALVGGGGQFSASVLLDGIMAHRRGLDDVRAIATLSYFLKPMVIRTDVAKAHGITRDMPLKARLQAMRGLRIAITTPGASSDMLLRYLFLQNGLQPDRDLQIVPLGGVSTQIAGLQAGQVDGCSCLPGVDIITNRSGLTEDVLNPDDMQALDGVTYGTLYSLASYDKAHPDVIRGVARAIARAELLIAHDSDAARKASRPFFKEMDDATFNASWITYAPYFPTDPEINTAGYEKELALEKAVLPPSASAAVPYDQVVNTSAVRAAMRELAK